MDSAIVKTPILILAFNRPDFLSDLLDIVVHASPERLYIAVDGPRKDNPRDAQAVREIWKIIEKIPDTIEVSTLLRQDNLGCRDAVANGITWFFEREPEGIILEDDCRPDSTFFSYCEGLLERFRNDSQVISVSGYRPNHKAQQNDEVEFSRYPQIWGWATWRRVWGSYDSSIREWPALRDSQWLRREVGLNPLAASFWKIRFDQVHSKVVNTWDYQFTFLAMRAKGLSLVPPVNLVRNVGFDARSTHTGPRVSRRINGTVGRLRDVQIPQLISRNRALDRWIEIRSYRIVQSVALSAVRYLFARIRWVPTDPERTKLES